MSATVKVVSDPKSGASTGDWVVKVGNRTMSRHRTKNAAEKAARKEAKKRNGTMKTQNTKGHWTGERSYE